LKTVALLPPPWSIRIQGSVESVEEETEGVGVVAVEDAMTVIDWRCQRSCDDSDEDGEVVSSSCF
jgi:hypothetical protein